MKKLANAAAALLFVALFAIPGVVGWMTEASVKARVAAIDESPSAAAELTSFDRGWFRSTAHIVLRPENVDQLAPVAATRVAAVSTAAPVLSPNGNGSRIGTFVR